MNDTKQVNCWWED